MSKIVLLIGYTLTVLWLGYLTAPKVPNFYDEEGYVTLEPVWARTYSTEGYGALALARADSTWVDSLSNPYGVWQGWKRMAFDTVVLVDTIWVYKGDKLP